MKVNPKYATPSNQIIPPFVKKDPLLKPYLSMLRKRQEAAAYKESELTRGEESLSDFASGYLYFGLHRVDSGWVFREWAPNAREIYLVGDFTRWEMNTHYSLERKSNGIWELFMPHEAIGHGDQYRLWVIWDGGSGPRIPAWTRKVWQDPVQLNFNAQVWSPLEPYNWKNPDFRITLKNPMIYECHVGMATERRDVGGYDEFTSDILPRIKALGYNTIQLMAIQEHPLYGSFGYQISSFFAPSSRFGTPDQLKALVDEAHSMGIAVIMDLVHSHSVKNLVEGLGWQDGSPYQYFHVDDRRIHPAWDSLCFDYGKNEVLHFLLSNCKYWLEEFHFDGFRFDGVTSMLYNHHGLEMNFTSYDMYFDGKQDIGAITYLTLANELIHQIRPDAICIAEEMSGFPGLCAPCKDGGVGFDFRMAMGIPDFWIKIIKEQKDEQWDVQQIFYELTNRRAEEKTISYAESHDQALVGDKTIIFRLMDWVMYTHMSKDKNHSQVDRAMALHKLIRLITFVTNGGGYLNFMGNEFGHPQWIDFPRPGNDWSYDFARRQWSLVDDHSLRYHLLADFDRDMVNLFKDESEFWNHSPELIHANAKSQILVFVRGDWLLAFNFNPQKSFPDYSVNLSPGKFKVVFHTDGNMHGGYDRVDSSYIYYTTPNGGKVAKLHHLNLYLPNRSAIILKRMRVKSVFEE